jgi:hypothetical protein
VPPVPDPPANGLGAPGPAYVLVNHVGVLRVARGEVATALKLPGSRSSWDVDLVAGPAGELWLSDWDGVRVLDPTGGARSIRLARGGPRYESLTVRSPADIWAVTSDIEWAIVHYDGKQWKPVRRRNQFPGMYDDNKIVALAVTSDAVWVSCWNGLWRGAGNVWQKIDSPAAASGFPQLWAYRDRLIASYPNGHFIRDGSTWKQLPWPLRASVHRVVSDLGLVAAPSLEGATVMIGPVEGEGCTAISDPLHGSRVHALAIDHAGRVWAATDHALAVLDRSGRIVAEWTPGTLEGLSGRISGIAVAGAGPERLPAPQPARTWTIVGRLKTYKSGSALANAALELCSAPVPEDDRCAPGSYTSTTTSDADGSFRFIDVPEGDFWISVRPPGGTSDCDGVFRVTGHAVAPARDCRADPKAPRRCDLGVLTQCTPFELPPDP